MTNSLFPAFLKLRGRRVVVVGGGPVAASKLASLQSAGADLLVVAAAPPEVNRLVAAEAERRQVFVNAVDDPENASVYLGGVVRRDGVTLAISTDGAAPALAGLLREALDFMLPADLSRWNERARDIRGSWRARGVPMDARRPELLEALNALYDARRPNASVSDTQPELVK